MKHMDLIIALITGLATAIPLVIKLVEYIKKSIQEKNWGNLIALITKLVEDAETMFTTGADRKAWVMARLEASADLINYDYDKEAISDLIDTLIAMTKKVNAPNESE